MGVSTLDWLLVVSACGTFGWAKIVSFGGDDCGWLAASVEFDFPPTRYRGYMLPRPSVGRVRMVDDDIIKSKILLPPLTHAHHSAAQRSMTKIPTTYIILID